MRDKIRYRLCRFAEALLPAGGIIFLIGLYYWIVKAGIPYQDPPPELQIQYAVNETIGMTLLANGFWVLLCVGALRLLLWLAGRKQPGKWIGPPAENEAEPRCGLPAGEK